MKHTCIDELIDVEDDKRWDEAMKSKETCEACNAQARAPRCSCGEHMQWSGEDECFYCDECEATSH